MDGWEQIFLYRWRYFLLLWVEQEIRKLGATEIMLRLAKGKEANKTWLCSSARYTRDTSCEQVRMDDRKLQEVLLRAIWTQCELFDAKVKRLDEQKRKAGKDKVFFLQEIERCRKLMEQAEREKLKLYEQYADENCRKRCFCRKKRK